MVAEPIERETGKSAEQLNLELVRFEEPRAPVGRRRPGRRAVRRARIVSIFRPEGMPAETLPRVRKDSLPDEGRYPDTGCELARSCLRCPLPRCQYDEPDSVRRWLADARDREIAVLRRRHRAPVEMLCRTYGLTRRTVYAVFVEQGVRTNHRDRDRAARRRPRGSRVPLKVLCERRTKAARRGKEDGR
ncbi:MAG: hypothetical protein HY873_06255 [Chloroflexi bacterium]|nr:hypothetical protein [Chloroflexota bacterium]